MAVSPGVGAGTPTFSRDVAAILWTNCAACHRPGQSAPFSLLTYQDARGRAERIAAVTESRYMPPWLPEPGHGSFLGDRRLSDQDLDTIQRWVAAGALEGDPSELPPLPDFPAGWQLGEPDLVVAMPEPFTLAAGEGDVFRSFVIPTPPGPRRYVASAEIRPGNARIVHHAELTIDETSSSRALDDSDPQVGFYTSMDFAAAAHRPDGQFIGWTPGKVVRPGREDAAWQLEGGSDLVLQLHMLPGSEAEQIQSSIGLYYAESPPLETSYVLRLGSTSIDIPAGEAASMIEDRYVLPVDVRAIGIYPHAHYLATDMKGFATLPDGRTEWLIWIKQWDFMKQDWYLYSDAVLLPKGTELTMQFTYDNTADNPRNPNDPPRRVTYGPNSSDEMGDLWIQVLLEEPRELATLAADFLAKEGARRIADLRRALAADPDNAVLHFDLAVQLDAAGEVDEAEGLLLRALQLDPGLSEAHVNLGVMSTRKRDVGGAEAHFREALRMEPEAADVMVNLGRILLTQRRGDEAVTLFRRALSIDPSMWQAHASLADAMVQASRFDTAVASYQQAILLGPDVAELHFNLGAAFGSQGLFADAEEEFRIALMLQPSSPLAHNRLGLVLERQGKVNDAIEQYQEALRLAPDFAQARENLQRASRIRQPQVGSPDVKR